MRPTAVQHADKKDVQLLPLFQIVDRFEKSRYMIFAMI
jgi:hypothetical protein